MEVADTIPNLERDVNDCPYLNEYICPYSYDSFYLGKYKSLDFYDRYIALPL
jgi:hypothetical protein